MLLTRTLPQELSDSLDELERAKAAIPPAFDLASQCHTAVSQARAAEVDAHAELRRARVRLRQAEAGFVEGRETLPAVEEADAAVRTATEKTTEASHAIERAAGLLAAAEARLHTLREAHGQAVRVVMKLAEEHFTAGNPVWRVKPNTLMTRGEGLAKVLHLVRQSSNAQGVPLLRHFLTGEPFRAVVQRGFFSTLSAAPFEVGDMLDVPKDMPMLDAVHELHNGRLALVTAE